MKPRTAALLEHLHAGDVDAAIEGGLLEWSPGPEDSAETAALVSAACARLRVAWAARERHRRREQRLATARKSSVPGPASAIVPDALPPAARSALARALAGAGVKP